MECVSICISPQELDAKVRTLRDSVKQAKKEYDKTEDDLKALQSVGQIIGEVLRQLDDERCTLKTPYFPKRRIETKPRWGTG